MDILEPGEEHYILNLFVTGASPNSIRAINNIHRICEQHLKGRYSLEVIDIHQQPDQVRLQDVTAVPMLIKKSPQPQRKLIGDMSNENKVLKGLGKEVYDSEISIQPASGKRFYISINAAPLYDKNGTLIGGVATFMDVTARRKISQQKDEFISVASHELKTPLTSLRASMQLLTRLSKSDPGSEKIPDFIEKANKNLQKILHLTEDLMNVSKIQHGQLNLNKSEFVLSQLVQDCCNHIRAEGTHDLHLEGDSDLAVYADQQRIDQVVVNLLNNAIKYAPNSRKIIIRIHNEGHKVRLSVQDFGIGIGPGKISHLFDRYYRADPSGIQFSGLGLGLYISAEIIERHGGSIGVDSKLGEGSTFWFTLPLDNKPE